MSLKRRVRKLEHMIHETNTRIAALEAAQAPQTFDWSHVPDAEPLDVHALWDAIADRYSHGYSDGDDWRGYL